MAADTRNLTGRSTVAGLFTEHFQAQQAIADLKAAGFPENQIGVAMRDANAQDQFATDSGIHGTHAGDGAATGGVIGGVLGLLVGIGALAIPGIGPVITAGILSQAIGAGVAGVAIGAVSGGIVGALIGLGIPDDEARHFETGFNAGGVLVTINAGPRAAEAVQILERNGGDTGASAYGRGQMDDMASGAYAVPAFGNTAADYADASSAQPVGLAGDTVTTGSNQN